MWVHSMHTITPIYTYYLDTLACTKLSDPVNGNVDISAIGSVATYSCNDGYVLSGSDTRTCESNGEWSGSPPTCEGTHSVQWTRHHLF